jgi:hypothetical protein
MGQGLIEALFWHLPRGTEKEKPQKASLRIASVLKNR